MIRPCGRVANMGVHGRPATLHLEKLWIRDVTLTTGLVDIYTIPRLMRLVASGRFDPTIFATHRFALHDTMGAYDTVRERRIHQGAERRARGQRTRSRLGQSRRGRTRMIPVCGLRAAIDMRQETI
jgi:hypothetical protein